MGIFSLVAVFTATIAWFAMNHNVGANQMTIKVMQSGQAFSTMTIHRCLFNHSTASTYVFDPEPEYEFNPSSTGSSSATQTGTFEMIDYDNGASELSASQPVLLLFHLGDTTTVEGSEVHHGVAAASVRLTARTDVLNPNLTFPVSVTSSNVNKYPFSHCVKFQSIASSSTGDFNFTIATASLSSDVTFAVETSETDAGGLNVWNFNSNLTLFTGSGSGVITYLGIVMDYYDEAIAKIMSDNLSNTILQANERLGLYCDWIMEI